MTKDKILAILWRLCAETSYADHEAREALQLASVAVEGGGDPSVSSSSDVLPNSARNLAAFKEPPIPSPGCNCPLCEKTREYAKVSAPDTGGAFASQTGTSDPASEVPYRVIDAYVRPVFDIEGAVLELPEEWFSNQQEMRVGDTVRFDPLNRIQLKYRAAVASRLKERYAHYLNACRVSPVGGRVPAGDSDRDVDRANPEPRSRPRDLRSHFRRIMRSNSPEGD